MAKASAIKAGDVYKQPRRTSKVAWLALLGIVFSGGWYVGRYSVQSANDLVEAGFTITDPEGFEVSRFDGSAIDHLTALLGY